MWSYITWLFGYDYSDKSNNDLSENVNDVSNPLLESILKNKNNLKPVTNQNIYIDALREDVINAKKNLKSTSSDVEDKDNTSSKEHEEFVNNLIEMKSKLKNRSRSM